MQIEITKRIGGNLLLKVCDTGDDFKELIRQYDFLINLPGACGVCSEVKSLTLTAREVKERDYISLRLVCKKCGSSLTAGNLKRGGYYWNKDKWVTNSYKLEEKSLPT